ncbi:MAG: hypothetical protein GXP31_13195 [Kiritimatiellaeota bacterium]|nr:hypothetical protein [Kiritimatiellota bacterium]
MIATRSNKAVCGHARVYAAISVGSGIGVVAAAVLIFTFGSTCARAARAAGTDTDLLGWWSFEQPPGPFAVDASSNGLDGEIVGARIVKGAFGQALECTGSDSYVRIPGPAGLDGSNELTIAAWVLWEQTGRYPNIVSGGQWSPGGFLVFVSNDLCSFRMGRPGHKAGKPGDQWREIGVTLLRPVPLRRWVHIAATFKRPFITGYVDGKKVGTARWDYPVGFSGDILLGAWGSGGVSHKGLIDEVKLYKRALGPAEIAAEVQRTAAGRDSTARTVLAPRPAPTVLSIRNSMARLEVDALARVSRLQDLATGAELLAGPPRPLAKIKVGGHWSAARRCRRDSDGLRVDFSRGLGWLKLRIAPAGAWFRITVERIEGKDVEALTFLELPVRPAADRSTMAGLARNETEAVCVRALNLATRVLLGGTPPVFRAVTSETYGIDKGRIALVAGPAARIRDVLKQVALKENVPVSKLGGPWSMDAPANRGSYLFARMTEDTVDEWIELARRGGFSCLHFSGWAKSLGHYEPNPKLFPHGIEGMKQCVDKIHAAGLRAGMHTLTGCIATNDPWVSPVPDPRLAADAYYTLAAPLTKSESDELRVLEKPGAHDVVWTYSGTGNVLRIGSELIQYRAIRRKAPFAFLDLQRGAFGGSPRAHAAGARVDHLRQRYLAFYPDENSTLVGELADRIARVYNTCGMDQIYQDGAEGMGNWHAIAVMRTAIFQRLKRPALVEASCHGHHNWWFHSRLGAWDHAKWAVKRFHDMHCAGAENYRKSALLEPQLGWWAFIGPSRTSRGQFPDEVEYFAVKNMALDAAMSLQGVSARGRPANARQLEYFTLLGWYERLRRARYFDAATLARLRPPGHEFRLRQTARGEWRFLPADIATHRAVIEGNAPTSWRTENRFAAQRLRLRIEALYSVGPKDAPGAKRIVDFAKPETLDLRQTASGVSQTVATVSMPESPAAGAVLRIQARNSGSVPGTAWSRIGRRFEPYLDISGNDGLGVWIYGDGKGEIVNLQLRTPREYHTAFAENCVRIDFTGWRYVELPFRERAAELYTKYKWPYRGAYSIIFRNPLDRRHVSEFNVILANLPPNDAVDIRIGSVRALPIRKVVLRNLRLVVNGANVQFPVMLKSGEYLEVDEDGGVHYDERGEILERFMPVEALLPEVRPGANAFSLHADPAGGMRGRAEVTIFTLGEPFGRVGPARSVDWALLEREYARPHTVLSQDGKNNVWDLRRRPDRAATIEFDLEVQRVGARGAAYNASTSILLDACDDPARFELSRVNRYAKYAYDNRNKGVPAKPGVTHELARETIRGGAGATVLRYSATSLRKDNSGWSAKGRRFDPPLDLSACTGLGFRLEGDGRGEYFKVQLRDVNGKWHDMVTRVDFTGWKTLEFLWDRPALDLSKIRYLIFYYNAIPAGETVRCAVDDVKAFSETGRLRNPRLTVGSASLTFPCELHRGQRLVFRGLDRCAVLSPGGAAPVAVRPRGTVPRLAPGTNPVTLTFGAGSPREFRVTAALTKIYGTPGPRH